MKNNNKLIKVIDMLIKEHKKTNAGFEKEIPIRYREQHGLRCVLIKRPSGEYALTPEEFFQLRSVAKQEGIPVDVE